MIFCYICADGCILLSHDGIKSCLLCWILCTEYTNSISTQEVILVSLVGRSSKAGTRACNQTPVFANVQ